MLKIPFEIPTYDIRRADSPPSLDGWLDSPAWRGATWIERFISVETDRTSDKATAAALLWDDRFLYLGARCEEPRIAYLKAEARKAREAWEDDTVELYLDPGVKGVESIDTAFSPAGVACPAVRVISDPGWGTYQFQEQGGIRVAVRFTGSGWQVEAAIPFGENRLPFPKAGDTWRGNVCRNDRLGYTWNYWAIGQTPGYVYSDNQLFPRLRFAPEVSAAPAAAPRRGRWPRQPRFELRGFMYDTSRGSLVYTPKYWTGKLPYFKSLGFNSVIMYFENHMRYASHPEFAPEGSWTLDDLSGLQEAAARHGIDIIPAQTSLGHCPGILKHPKYRHLAEAGSEFNGEPYQFCVAHPETQTMLADMFSELAKASRSPFVSINADESGYLGLCPRCRQEFAGWSKGKIFRHHILRLYDVIRSHGKRMMMWDDMLWSLPDALEGLPRDIVLLDWHYTLHRRYPSVDVWRAMGFDVVVCPGMYLVENAFWLSDYGAARGAMGMINTLWEEHSLPIGARWPQWLATSWAAHAEAPRSTEEWYVRAGERLFGPTGGRLGRSLAGQDLVSRNGYRIGRAAPSPAELLARRQVLGEAEALRERAALKGQAAEMADEFIYAGRLQLLQAELADLKARGALDAGARAGIAARAEALKKEGLARWERQCACESQKPAFLERYAAIAAE